jgi:hypothetical protein
MLFNIYYKVIIFNKNNFWEMYKESLLNEVCSMFDKHQV